MRAIKPAGESRIWRSEILFYRLIKIIFVAKIAIIYINNERLKRQTKRGTLCIVLAYSRRDDINDFVF